jgi:RNA polymerase sigma-70 factor (ECF subfamily)
MRPCPEIEDGAMSATERLEQKERQELLWRAMFKLPLETRELLVLVRYHEMKYSDVAQLLGCEVGTVRVRVHRALQDLREQCRKLANEKQPCAVKKFANKRSII